MAGGEPIDDSFLQLIKCAACLEEADQLKYLSCQHTICLLCVDKLTISQNLFKCPKCDKQLPVPNGGFDQLPDCLVTKEISELLKKRRTTKSKGSGPQEEALSVKGVSAKDLQLSELKKELDKEIEAGKRWHKKAEEMMKHQSDVLEQLPEVTQATKDVFTGYQQTTVLKCQQKLQGITKSLREETEALKECINKLQPDADRMKDAMKPVPDQMKKLSAKSCSPQQFEEASQILQSLKEMTRAVNRTNHDLDNSGDITVGDSVRLRYVEDDDRIEDFVNGKVSNTSIGILAGVRLQTSRNPMFPMLPMGEKRTPLVIFPEKHDWEGENVQTITKSYTKAHMPFIGDRVRIKASVTSPHFSWKGVRAKKSRGVFKKIDHNATAPADDLVVVIDFTEERGWRGLYSEIELWPGCGFEVGDEVRVSSSIPEPSRGWAGVNGSSVGKVKKVKGAKGQEDIFVDFPECIEWIGLATELEMNRKPAEEDKVQVKLSVKTPKLGWGGVTHENVGTLMRVLSDREMGNVAQVKFPHRRQEWSCKLEELETVRYQPPDYGPEEEEEVEVDFGMIMRLHLLQQMGLGMGNPFW